MSDTSVFISSTFTDLKAYRAAVRSALQRLGAKDLAMESFGSRDERPLAECRSLIRSDADIFVGLYAHRYGYVPRGKKTSITASEYQTASTAGVPVLAYVVDARARWPAAKKDQGEPAKRLQTLKSRLKRNHIVSFFSRRDELAAMVAADVGRTIARRETRVRRVRELSGESRVRERRLLDSLRAGPPDQRERAASALSSLGSDVGVATLIRLMLGPDEALAKSASRALEWGAAIADGMWSPHESVRYWSAFRVGENALQDHAWGLEQVPGLVDLIESKAETAPVVQQATHSLGKVGGRTAMDSLLRIIGNAGVPPQVAITALHAPGRFWRDEMFASSASYDLFPQFQRQAIAAIESWSGRRRASIARQPTFPELSFEIATAIDARKAEERRASRSPWGR